jgi:hypothetical protein
MVRDARPCRALTTRPHHGEGWRSRRKTGPRPERPPKGVVSKDGRQNTVRRGASIATDLAAFQRGLHTGGGTADAGDGTCTPTHRCAYTGTVQRPLGNDGTLHPGNSSRES